MKTQKSDLNLDFIGGEGSLTKLEEKALSDFFKSRKMSANTIIKAKKTKHQAKVTR